MAPFGGNPFDIFRHMDEIFRGFDDMFRGMTIIDVPVIGELPEVSLAYHYPHRYASELKSMNSYADLCGLCM